jgi:NUMOD3 motif
MPRKRKNSQSSSSESQYDPEEDSEFDYSSEDVQDDFVAEDEQPPSDDDNKEEDENSTEEGGQEEGDGEDNEKGDAKKPPAAKRRRKDKENPSTYAPVPRLPNERYHEEGYVVDEHGNRKHITPANRRNWKRKVIVVDEEELNIPSAARKTVNGGYAATSVHRSKISKANAGKVPWNFGRHRSSADRAKIAAGVRAKIRQRLLRQLEDLGMTEEEWLDWKRKIKNMRNSVQRIRSNNRKAANIDVYNNKLKEAQVKHNKEKAKKLKDVEVRQEDVYPLVYIWFC